MTSFVCLVQRFVFLLTSWLADNESNYASLTLLGNERASQKDRMHKLRTRKQTIAQMHQLGDHMCWASSKFDTEEAQESFQKIVDQSLEHIQEQTAQKKAVLKVED